MKSENVVGVEVLRLLFRGRKPKNSHLCRLVSYAFCLSGPGAPAGP